MRRLLTKASRLAVQEATFQRLIEKGYSQEVYKGLNIFTAEKDGKFYLEIYRDGSSKQITGNYYYKTVERIQGIIDDNKKLYDRRLAFKEEQKTKGGYKSSSAMCAAAIRAELKNIFPGIKFSVTSDTFSMGNSVDVRWSDGPTTEMVDEVIDKYQYGRFDGSQDLYEYTNNREDIPQAKYVHSSRSMSDATKAVLQPIAAQKLERDEHNRDVLYMIFRKSAFPAGAVITGLTDSATQSGSIEDFYQIIYESPDQPKPKAIEVAPDYEKVEVPEGEIQIVDYSERSFAVIGSTKPIKDLLSSLGGKMNYNLSCGPGWIFSKKRLDSVQEKLNQLANV